MLVLKSFLKFATLSAFGWLLDLVILLLLNRIFNIPVFYANLFSSIIAATMVFTISRRKIHAGHSDRLLGRISLYIIYTIIVILIASSAMPLLIGFISNIKSVFPNIAFNDGLVVLFAKIIITPPQLLANFFVSRLIARLNYTKPINQTE